MIIELDTHDANTLPAELFGDPLAEQGRKIITPSGAELELQGHYFRKGGGFPDTLVIAVQFGLGVSTGLVANWMWSKIGGRVRKMRVDRIDIRLEEGEVKRVIIEHIEREGGLP